MSDVCSKCNGTGWYAYDHNHSKICEHCCTHPDGWWELTEHYYRYEKDKDNACCRKGCGTMRRDLIKEPNQPQG